MKNCNILRKFSAILAMLVVTTVLFPLKACTKEVMLEEPTTGVITMTTQATEVSFSVAGDKDITVDWGDGKKCNVSDASYEEGYFTFSHVYSDAIAYNVVVTGNVTELYCANIELTALDVSKISTLSHLYCGRNQLTVLDVSKNTVLTKLWVYQNRLTALDVSKNAELERLDLNYNQIKSLDVSKNTALTILSIVGNQFTASALNELFRTLPDYSKSDYGGVIYLTERHPLAVGNPGNSDCDRNIARDRGWGFMSLR